MKFYGNGIILNHECKLSRSFSFLYFSLTHVDLVGVLRIVAVFTNVGTCIRHYAINYGDSVQLPEQSPTCHHDMKLNFRVIERNATPVLELAII